MSEPVLGVLGGGQLGRMLAQAASKIGVRTRVFDPSPEACAREYAELVVGAFDDRRALAWFCDGLETATVEFENVPIETARFVAERVSLFPGPRGIEPAQDRVPERALLARAGFETPACTPVETLGQIDAVVDSARLPLILKSRRFGYDGKGQAWVRDPSDASSAWERIGRKPAILDEAVSFDREVSLLAVRGRDGTKRHYDPVENVHAGGILHTSRAPATVDAVSLGVLRASVERLMDETGYVGVLAVELFQVGDRFLANEYAPRVHNSGHWTIEGAVTSQFENHVRAVMGMPLGATDSRAHAGMVNLIGSTDAAAGLKGADGAFVHLYGKEPRPGRKVGHVTFVAESSEERDARVRSFAASAGGGA